jgi:hypothetical protein
MMGELREDNSSKTIPSTEAAPGTSFKQLLMKSTDNL